LAQAQVAALIGELLSRLLHRNSAFQTRGPTEQYITDEHIPDEDIPKECIANEHIPDQGISDELVLDKSIPDEFVVHDIPDEFDPEKPSVIMIFLHQYILSPGKSIFE